MNYGTLIAMAGVAGLSLISPGSVAAANAAASVERYWTGGTFETAGHLCDRYACPRGSFEIRLVADDAYGSRLSGAIVDRQGDFSFDQPMEAGTRILSVEITEETGLYHCEIVERAGEVFPIEAAINAANPIRLVKVKCTVTAEGRKAYDDARAEKEASDRLLSQQGVSGNMQVPPPIGPGEIYAETANHCGVVLNQSELIGKNLSEVQTTYGKLAWYGRCVDGLIDGEGQFAEPGGPITFYLSEYILGRRVGSSKRHDISEKMTTYSSGDQWVDIFDGPRPFGPRWGYYSKTFYAPGMGSSIESGTTRCTYGLEKETKRFGCSASNNFEAYRITVKINDKLKTLVCPDPRTSDGCEDLWMGQGKPIFDSIKAFIAPIESGLSARRARYLGLITPTWRAQAESKRVAVVTERSG